MGDAAFAASGTTWLLPAVSHVGCRGVGSSGRSVLSVLRSAWLESVEHNCLMDLKQRETLWEPAAALPCQGNMSNGPNCERLHQAKKR